MRSFNHHSSNQEATEIKRYVKLMKEARINTIVEMNKYISRNDMWDDFSDIRRENVNFTFMFPVISLLCFHLFHSKFPRGNKV